MNASQATNRIKIRRNSNKSLPRQIFEENRSLPRKTSFAQSYDGSHKHFSNENSIPNEQQIENNDSTMNYIERNEEENFSVKSARRTSMDKIKVTRTRTDSISIHNETDQRNKPTIKFVPKRSFTRVERLHGEEFLPLNNDQYSKISQSEKDDRQRYTRNRR